jgi:hypothetical protein
MRLFQALGKVPLLLKLMLLEVKIGWDCTDSLMLVTVVSEK